MLRESIMFHETARQYYRNSTLFVVTNSTIFDVNSTIFETISTHESNSSDLDAFLFVSNIVKLVVSKMAGFEPAKGR